MPITPKGETVTLTDIQANVSHSEILTGCRETDTFIANDHWQNGKGWVGYNPLRVAKPTQQDIEDYFAIREKFAFKNVLKRIPKRISGAVLGYDPVWFIHPASTLSESERDAVKEEYEIIAEYIKEWLNQNSVFRLMKRKVVENYAKHGHVGMQIRVPAGFVNEETGMLLNSPKEFKDYLPFIKVDSLNIYNSAIEDDVDFGSHYTMVTTERDDGQSDFAVNYLNAKNECCVRFTISGEEIKTPMRYDLGGLLLTKIISEPENAIIDKSTKSLQKILNHALSMINFAIAKINFPPTYIINAKPFEAETSDDANRPGFLRTGINSLFELVGEILIGGVDGASETQVKPDVKFGKTAEPKQFEEIARQIENHIYDSAGMAFVEINNSPYPSGKSRQEALTDYLILLTDIATTINEFGEWLITALIRYIYNLMGVKNIDKKLKEFEVSFDCKLLLKFIDNEDRQIMLDEVRENVRSKTGYMLEAKVTANPANMQREIEIELKRDRQMNPKPNPPEPDPKNPDEV